MTKASNILAYTVSHHDRGRFLESLIPDMRGTAGVWFDWLVCLGAPSEGLQEVAEKSLNHPLGRGIQALVTWPENRGQHHATQVALDVARAQGYEWLLRLDDDVQPKTKRWLKKLVDYTEELRKAAKDKQMRIVSAPKLLGLNNPLTPVGVVELKGLSSKVDAMGILGGACRLHPVEFLDKFEPPLYAPIGREDPESMAGYVLENQGILVRFPAIRMVHRTSVIEAQDTAEAAVIRNMSRYWPFLGPQEVAE